VDFEWGGVKWAVVNVANVGAGKTYNVAIQQAISADHAVIRTESIGAKTMEVWGCKKGATGIDKNIGSLVPGRGRRSARHEGQPWAVRADRNGRGQLATTTNLREKKDGDCSVSNLYSTNACWRSCQKPRGIVRRWGHQGGERKQTGAITAMTTNTYGNGERVPRNRNGRETSWEGARRYVKNAKDRKKAR